MSIPPAPPTPGQSQATVEMAQINLAARIPEFWVDQPRIWFIQAEAVLAPQKLSDQTRYNLVVTKLSKEVIRQVTDILLNPPEANKFNTIKERLISIYEDSEIRRLQKLMSEMELGEQKPSQLLRRMKDLARDQLPEDTLKILWQGHLPSSVRAVLAVTEEKSTDKLAAIADKILETSGHERINEIKSEPKGGDTSSILAELAKINLRIASMERRQENDRSRSSSRQGNRSNRGGRSRTPKRADWLCRYHFRFREKARKCVEPCTWKKQGN